MKPEGEPAGRLLGRLKRRDPRIAETLSGVYPGSDEFSLAREYERYQKALQCFVSAYGPDSEVAVFRAPGRLNILEYLDMARGPHLSAALDRDLLLVASCCEGDELEVVHCNPLEFPPLRLRPVEELRRLRGEACAKTWAEAVRSHPHAGRDRGDYANYLLAPLLRIMWEEGTLPTTGMRWALGPSALPMRAGLSSSSALVVLGYLAFRWCNHHRQSNDLLETARMLGEAEWYVGTRGGANDHMTILLNPSGGVVINHHEASPPWAEPLPFPDGIEILVIHTLWEADKAMGAMGEFNTRRGEMDLAATLVCKYHPELSDRFIHLGSLSPDFLGVTKEEVEQVVESLPEYMSVEEAGAILGVDAGEILRRFPAVPNAPYRLRSRAGFFQKELELGGRIKEILLRSREVKAGSPEHEELLSTFGCAINEIQQLLREDMEVSCMGIDDLAILLGGIRGVLGAKLTGAGFGGCVAAFCREGQAENVAEVVKQRYFVPGRFDLYRRRITEIPNSAVRQALIKRMEEGLSHPERAILDVRIASGAGRMDF
ncbi:MAG: hypothetical protein JRG73_12500 [Deltaproteobacteria bacterium]|nr:hypothetical protein [Deltaproteobacteria bacterium]